MTVKELLAIAAAEVGTKEVPAGSNNVKYNTWYYRRAVSGAAYPWCMTFVQWCFAQAGEPIGYKTASCTALMNWAKQTGSWVTSGYKPGDVLIFDFGADGGADHTGILEAINGSALISIEGNTSLTSNDNGGAVMSRNRNTAQVLGAWRPTYAPELDNTPSKWADEAVKWAQSTGLLRGNENGNLHLHDPVTREEMCVFIQRFNNLI